MKLILYYLESFINKIFTVLVRINHILKLLLETGHRSFICHFIMHRPFLLHLKLRLRHIRSLSTVVLLHLPEFELPLKLLILGALDDEHARLAGQLGFRRAARRTVQSIQRIQTL